MRRPTDTDPRAAQSHIRHVPIWPEATALDANGELTFHGRTASSLLDEFGSPLYLIDTDEVAARARRFVRAAADAFHNTTTHVSFAGKAFLSKEVVRIVTEAGMLVDTCSMGEMRIALAAGAPGRRLVLHGNNKSDEEIALAIEQGFAKIVVDSPDEPARIAAIARRLGKRARVMLRVTAGIHAGGHEFISTAHEDQKFGVPLLPAGADASVLAILSTTSTASRRPARTSASNRSNPTTEQAELTPQAVRPVPRTPSQAARARPTPPPGRRCATMCATRTTCAPKTSIPPTGRSPRRWRPWPTARGDGDRGRRPGAGRAQGHPRAWRRSGTGRHPLAYRLADPRRGRVRSCRRPSA